MEQTEQTPKVSKAERKKQLIAEGYPFLPTLFFDAARQVYGDELMRAAFRVRIFMHEHDLFPGSDDWNIVPELQVLLRGWIVDAWMQETGKPAEAFTISEKLLGNLLTQIRKRGAFAAQFNALLPPGEQLTPEQIAKYFRKGKSKDEVVPRKPTKYAVVKEKRGRAAAKAKV